MQITKIEKRCHANDTWQQNKKLCYRGEHSASDFGTYRKLICDFLLVINTNLHPILHRFQVMAETPSLVVIPCEYRLKWYIAKN